MNIKHRNFSIILGIALIFLIALLLWFFSQPQPVPSASQQPTTIKLDAPPLLHPKEPALPVNPTPTPPQNMAKHPQRRPTKPSKPPVSQPAVTVPSKLLSPEESTEEEMFRLYCIRKFGKESCPPVSSKPPAPRGLTEAEVYRLYCIQTLGKDKCPAVRP